MEDAVGPVLRMCDEVDLVIRAIEDDNPAAFAGRSRTSSDEVVWHLQTASASSQENVR